MIAPFPQRTLAVAANRALSRRALARRNLARGSDSKSRGSRGEAITAGAGRVSGLGIVPRRASASRAGDAVVSPRAADAIGARSGAASVSPSPDARVARSTSSWLQVRAEPEPVLPSPLWRDFSFHLLPRHFLSPQKMVQNPDTSSGGYCSLFVHSDGSRNTASPVRASTPLPKFQ